MPGHLNPVTLARAQFAFTVSFHFIFPSLSIGLASYLAVLEALWLKTRQGVYANLYRYWLEIFAVAFGMKSRGAAQVRARRLAFGLGIATLLALAAVSAATPFLTYDYWRRWFSLPGVLLTAQVSLLGYVGLGISLYPYLVPRSVTLWQAAAPPQSQLFMLVGACSPIGTRSGWT